MDSNKKGGMFVFIKCMQIGSMRDINMVRKSSLKKGMTLIEVLIALVILSVGVGAMMEAMIRCLSVVRTARNREMARSLLRRIDVEFPIDEKAIDELSEDGDFDDVEGYVWSREILVVDEEERPGLFIVTTRVQWAERGRDTFEEVTIYKYVPDAESVTSKT